MKKEEIEKKILIDAKKTIDDYNMLKGVKSAIIAFSAGPDSVCLLDVLKTIYGKKIEFCIVYVNHGLRQKIVLRKEEELTRFYARKYKCAYKIIKIKVPESKKGIEAEARERRYDALITYARKISAEKIVLGHNLDDLVETFFMNLIRGSGNIGLQAISAVRLPFVRPLINIRKAAILSYLQKKGLRFSRDLSNINLDIRRNYIRKKIIPLMLNLNPQLYEVVKREIGILHNDEEFIQSFVEKVFKKIVKKEKDGFTIDLNHLFCYNKAIITRIIMQIIKSLKGDLRGLTSKHIEEVVSLKNKLSGKKISLLQNIYAQRIFRKIFIGYSKESKIKKFYIPLKINKEVSIGNLRLNLTLVKKYDLRYPVANCEVFDFTKIYPPLFLRNRKAGDIIKIKNGRKKLKEILNEAKIPINERDNVMLLCDQHNILWVIGVRRAEQAYIDDKTKNILRVEFEYLN